MTARETGAVVRTFRVEPTPQQREAASKFYADNGDCFLAWVNQGDFIEIELGPLSRPQPTPAGEIVERAQALIDAYRPQGMPQLLPPGSHEAALKRVAAVLAASDEQQAAIIAELREVLEMTTRALEIVNETMAEQGFGQSNSSVAVAQIGRATLERTRGQ
jgi:hypothetical protein